MPQRRPLTPLVALTLDALVCGAAGLAGSDDAPRPVVGRSLVTSEFGIVGYDQAVARHAAGVNFGASNPRHDGAAIPEAPPVYRPGAAGGAR